MVCAYGISCSYLLVDFMTKYVLCKANGTKVLQCVHFNELLIVGHKLPFCPLGISSRTFMVLLLSSNVNNLFIVGQKLPFCSLGTYGLPLSCNNNNLFIDGHKLLFSLLDIGPRTLYGLTLILCVYSRSRNAFFS